MRITNISCAKCGAVYARAVSATLAPAVRGHNHRCAICDTPLEERDATGLVAYRLIIAPDTSQILR
ncbi:MAG: hypothetical protein P4M07_22580 [Xanthobacteraceae bacterium]|nr:hypothetical protein [Xanthobacteraceae bacterium]